MRSAIECVDASESYRRHGRSRVGTETLFLCWWALSVFGFFVVTGTHPHYIMPMVVPMGLLCGRLVDRGLRPSPEAAGLAVGLYLTLMNSPLVGRGIRFVTQGALPPLPPVRFALVVGVVGVLIAVVYRDQWLPVIRPEIDPTLWAGVTKQAFIVSVVVLLLLQVPMADNRTHPTMDQKQLGQRFHAATPPDATVYVHPSAQKSIYTFAFYVQRPLQETTLKQLNTDPDVRYGLVAKSAVEKLRRPHGRIGTMTVLEEPLVLVEFNDRSATGTAQ